MKNQSRPKPVLRHSSMDAFDRAEARNAEAFFNAHRENVLADEASSSRRSSTAMGMRNLYARFVWWLIRPALDLGRPEKQMIISFKPEHPKEL